MQKTFQEFGFPSILNEALERIGYKNPTPIQEQTIPLALEGKDILGSAQTGTGKTAAFMLPLIAQLIKNPEKTGLVLTPTRELAAQVLEFTQKLLGRKSGIESALLIGGEPMFPQLRQLRNRPRIVVGTPGRVNDHLMRGTLSLKNTGIFVLDETDRMLDMGFGVQIEAIAGFLPEERQTFMFSATLPAEIIRLTQKYLKNPAQVHINATHAPAANIQQDTINVSQESKFPELLKELDKRAGSVIIFVKTKYGAEKLARSLRDEKHSTDFLHGDLRQNRRNKVVRDFRERKHRVLIATDVAARGLDIPHIEHVINYDLPQCPEDYIHRIGRTARAGAKGSSLCLIAPQDRRLWAAIQHMLDPKKHQKPAPERSGRRGGRGGNGGGRGGMGGRGRSFFGNRDRDGRGGSGFDRGGSNGFSRSRDREAGEHGENRGFRSEAREGGFRRENREDGFQRENREGGFKRDGFRSEAGNRENGFRRENRESGFGASRDGGFKRDGFRSEGGFKRENRESGFRSEGAREGGFVKREGGFGGGFKREGRENGFRSEGSREGGFGKGRDKAGYFSKK